MHQWDLAAGGICTRKLKGHTRSVHCLTLGSAMPFGPPALFTGSRDHSIKIWDLRSPLAEHTLKGHQGSVTCIASDGWKLLSGGGYNRGADDDEVLSVDNSLRLWDLRKLGGAEGRSPCVWCREAKSASAVSGQTELDMPMGMPYGDPILSLQLTGDKALTSHGGRQWTARVWDVLTGESTPAPAAAAAHGG